MTLTPPPGLFAAPVEGTQVRRALTSSPDRDDRAGHVVDGAVTAPSESIVPFPQRDRAKADNHDGVVPRRPDQAPAPANPDHGADVIVDAIFSGRFCMVDLVPDLGALERGEMSLVYRPIYDLVTGAVVSLQTLARWNPSNGGVGRAIDIAGSTDMNGSTRSIGTWIVKTACFEAWELQRQVGRPDMSVRMPVFGRQLENADLIDDVAQALVETELEPELVVLEVPETVAMGGNSSARSVIDALKALGVRMSIAEFGSGYTSAEYLQFLEVDEITIRCPFLPDHPRGPGPPDSVLYPLVNLTHATGLRIVVEGVDTFSQLTQVRDAGVRYAEGDLLGPAMDAVRLGKQMSIAPQFSAAVRTAASL
jgi:EAL domain-containing protein (putative c-di-GMP-specific phosphodiesterase class I)